MKIHHVAMWVDDLEVMRSFYKKYFAARSGDRYENRRSGFSSYFLEFGEEGRLEIMHMASIPGSLNSAEDQYRGLIHIALSTGSAEAVRDLTERLRIDGFPVVSEPRFTGDGYFESCILDPEGNRVEITE